MTLCSDCPRVWHFTDRTRCAECPRRRPRYVITGVTYVQTGPKMWAPDYDVPGTAEAVKKSVDDAYSVQWRIDQWRQ
jgi:hypothetical protein